MQKKELLLVAVATVLVVNLSIAGTLLASGYFAGEEEAAEHAPQQEVEADSDAEAAADGAAGQGPAEPKPSAAEYLHSMAEAMYICEDKFLASTAGVNKSYEFKHSESYFSEEDEIYRIFIEFETIGKPGMPAQASSVMCDVSAPKRTVAGYKVLPL